MFPIRRLTSGLYVPQHAALRAAAPSSGISRVNSGTGAGSGSGASFAITLTGIQENDVVVCVLATDFKDGSAIQESGYTNLDNNQDPGILAAWKRMGASPDAALTFGITGGAGRDHCACAAWYRGVDTVTALDAVTVLANNSTGAANPGSLTTATNNACRIILAAVEADEFTATAPATFGNIVSAKTTGSGALGASAMMADRTEATAGALDPAAFGGGANVTAWRAVHLALRPAS